MCGKQVDAATVGALADRTDGNPFYVRESARLLASEGALVAVSEVPQGVRDVLRRRLRQLPEGALALLQLASVVGREIEICVLVEAADPVRHDEHAVLDAAEAGVVAGLLTEPAPGVVRFAHALVRDTLYTDLVGVRRARLHARLAEVLRRRRPTTSRPSRTTSPGPGASRPRRSPSSTRSPQPTRPSAATPMTPRSSCSPRPSSPSP